MNEVAFDRMITDEYERYIVIEKEYKRYKPVKNERIVYRTYKSVSVKKGRYKTLLQWEEQVRSDYGQYSGAWIKDTAKVLEYHRRVRNKSLMFSYSVYAAVFAVLLSVSLTLFAKDYFLYAGIAMFVLAISSHYVLRGVHGLMNKILFYEELARIMRDMA
ncbi:MAG: hypothetical protein FWE91_07610 [Defluviitaleaceae bacterium]|nr:hypothetical protein [Defluviitaleaceae bacterium]MCL2836414.1 hypothetical protein [Defluviitaleaceae bacterium]